MFDWFKKKRPTTQLPFPPLNSTPPRVQIDSQSHVKFQHLTMPTDWALYLMSQYGQFDGSPEDSDILADVGRILTGCPITVWEITLPTGEKDHQIEVGTTCPNFEMWYATIESQKNQAR